MLSFKRIDKESKFLKNVYSINNPKYPLGVNPTLIYQQRDMLYIGSSEPTVIMRIDRVSFEAKNILDFPGNKLEAAFSTDKLLFLNTKDTKKKCKFLSRLLITPCPLRV